MSGLKLGVLGTGAILPLAYIGFVDKLFYNPSPYFDDINDASPADRFDELETVAGVGNVIIQNNVGVQAIATADNTKIMVSYDDLAPHGKKRKRVINISLPEKIPSAAELIYLDKFIKQICNLALTADPPEAAYDTSAAGLAAARKFLFGVMLLTRCM